MGSREIEHMHNFDETWVSSCHMVQKNEKPGRKTANINTKKLRSFITVKAHCSLTHNTAKIIWFLVLQLAMDVMYDFCYIHSPTGDYPTSFDAITEEGHRPNIAITFRTEKLEWWSIMQVMNVQSVMIRLAVSI